MMKHARTFVAENEGMKKGPSYRIHKGLIGTNCSKAPVLKFNKHLLFVVVPSANIASLN